MSPTLDSETPQWRYSQILYLESSGISEKIVVIHHNVGISNSDLLDWYSKEYEIERDRLMVSICPVPIVNCPLEPKLREQP